jgi:hypothetical protein
MSNSVQSHPSPNSRVQAEQIVHSLPAANVRTKVEQSFQPPQQLQATVQNPIPRHSVAISSSALELSAGYGFHEIRSLFREIFSFR